RVYHVELSVFQTGKFSLGLEMTPGYVIVLPAQLAQRFERAHLRDPRRPRVNPVWTGIFYLRRERSVIAGPTWHTFLVDRLDVHLFRKLYGVIHLAAREGYSHGGESHFYRALRCCFDEIEGGAAIELRSVARRAEL